MAMTDVFLSSSTDLLADLWRQVRQKIQQLDYPNAKNELPDQHVDAAKSQFREQVETIQVPSDDQATRRSHLTNTDNTDDLWKSQGSTGRSPLTSAKPTIHIGQTKRCLHHGATLRKPTKSTVIGQESHYNLSCNDLGQNRQDDCYPTDYATLLLDTPCRGLFWRYDRLG
ncbi:MAG TPA: hypothetical protein VG122_16315 [Gemmata sp.]|nr:hypothetical protein [Gemmata sp.]